MFELEKHRLILLQILKDVYTDPFLGNFLGFKGGTAVYFLYQLPRFSVDLDFDLLAENQADRVFARIEPILERYGTITEKQDKRFTIFFLLSYQAHGRNIKIEISKRVFPNHYELKTLLGIPLKVMVKADIFAHKLVTLLERKTIANRDLYDLWFFLKNNWEINTDLVEFRVQGDFKKYLLRCLRAIEKVNQNYLLQGLGELLDNKQKLWVKDKLKDELIFLFQARFLR